MNRTHRIAAVITALTLVLVAYALWPNQAHGDVEKLDDERATSEFLEEIESLPKFTDAPSFRQEAGDRPSHRLRGQLVGELESDLVYGTCLSLRGQNDWPYRPAISSDASPSGIDSSAFGGSFSPFFETNSAAECSPIHADGSFEIEVISLDPWTENNPVFLLVFARRMSSPSGENWNGWPAPVVAQLELTHSMAIGIDPIEVEVEAPLRLELQIDRREAPAGAPVEVEFRHPFDLDFISMQERREPMRLECPEHETVILLLAPDSPGKYFAIGAGQHDYLAPFPSEFFRLSTSQVVALKVHGYATVSLRVPLLSAGGFRDGDVELKITKNGASQDSELSELDSENVVAYHSAFKVSGQHLLAECQLLPGTWEIEAQEKALPLNRIHWQFVARAGARDVLQGSWRKARATLVVSTAYHCPFQPMFRPEFWWRSRVDGWQADEELRWRNTSELQDSRTVSRDVNAAAALLLCGTGEDPPRSQLCLLSTDSIQATGSASHFLCKLDRRASLIEVPAQSGPGGFTIEWYALSDHPDLPMESAREASEENPALLFKRVFSPRGGRITGFPEGSYRLRTLSGGVVEYDEVVQVIES